MRQVTNIILIALIGLIIGGGSAWYAIRQNNTIGSITIGIWSAWPFVGGDNVDPYTGAKVTVAGSIPLGASEGLSFEAIRDENGDLLSLECSYSLEGSAPQARLWTLVPYAANGRRMTGSKGGQAAFLSPDLLRYPDGSFTISISPQPKPGNWMSITGTGNFRLIMRLYDTPVTSNVGLLDPVIPTIVKQGCKN